MNANKETANVLTLTQNPIFARRPDAAQDELQERTALTRTTRKRQLVEALQSKNAIRDIRKLPGPEESLHVIARGNFPLFKVIPAILSLAKPCSIDVLHVATLGFSKSNAAELFDLLDTGKVKHVHIVGSVYFERQSPREWRTMSEGLSARHQQIIALRSHAKVIAMRLSDARGFTVESSANLRSCRNLEQLTITRSEALERFHARWIEEAIRNGK